MHSFKIFSMSLAIVSVIVFLGLTSSTEAQPEYRYHFCSNTTTFAPNSTYKSNLDRLLSYLTSNATGDRGFYNTSVGRAPATEVVYGSFLCRGDVTADDCRNCVETAAREAAQSRCPVGKEAVLWYAQCTLRYSNRYFFGVMYEAPRVTLSNTGNINDANRFNALMENTMNESITAAASTPAGAEKFATREASFSALQTLYNLVQCTPDLSSTDCNMCLRGAAALLPTCCSGKPGANVLYPSCNIRYEIYPFYRMTAAPPSQTPAAPAPPPLQSSPGSGGNSKISATIIAAISIPIAVVLLLMSIAFYCLKGRERRGRDEYNVVQNDQSAGNDITTVESLQYDLATIQTATNNFSDDNMLGKGGFGTVYKGVLSNGQEIAVKRLSTTSLQGAGEFKNEVMLVAKLQHRNLTRLLGFCLEGEEKLLVYEFVPNKSLDNFLFDNPENQAPLDWARRYKIIGGIARGILYLHEDSRLRIIHRDLKASNILLEEQMNPKISDFGMAKICGVDQTQGNTSRIVGTYGYMAPEYAFYGKFSVKSDVYSFGVLVIEIVTGKKSTGFLDEECSNEDLLSLTWRHWRDGTVLELLDSRLGDSYTVNEVIRCIHIGLLCVQEDPADRPTMATIVLMLSSFSISLPLPKQPAFFPYTRSLGSMPAIALEPTDKTSSKLSINEMSFSETYPR